MSFVSVICLLLLCVSLPVFSEDTSFQKLPVPGKRSGPEAFAFDSTGKGFYTGVSGGKIFKYLPGKGFVDFAYITISSKSQWCDGALGTANVGKCGRPAGIAFNNKTGELYVADAPLGLHVISRGGGLAKKIADSVDGKPFLFLDGLDVDPTTGIVYFTSFSSNFTPGEKNRRGFLLFTKREKQKLVFTELYVADAPLGLHVISRGGGLAKKIADSVDGKPFLFLDGLDVDPTTGVVYFTSFSSNFTPGDVLKAVASKDSTGKLFKYDPSTKVVTVLMEGLSGSAGCAVSSDGSFVLVSQFTKSNIKRYWIKGTKAGSFEDFTNSVSNPDNIKRIGSSGNFWVASVVNTATGPTNPSAVKINSDGKVVQTISVKDQFGDTLVSEVNEFKGHLYVGTLFGTFAGILKL